MSRDITQLHPRLQEKIAKLKVLCQENGLELGIGECFRSVAEQEALYAQGRTAAGNIITNARGTSYSSQHQWGIAFDFFKNVKGQEYSDNTFFTKVANLAKSIGLAWGGDWTGFVDKPHLYLTDWGDTTSILKERYGTFEKFKATWGTMDTSTNANVNASTTAAAAGKEKYMFEPKTVQYGSTGTSVLLCQEILKARGFKGADGKDLQLDQHAGDNTVYAINAYQDTRRKQGVELGTDGKNDGICGKKMWADLIAI